MTSPAPTAAIERDATGFGHDTTLPHRDTLLDAHAMRDRLAEAFDIPISSCRRARTKYRVGESLRVLFEVAAEHGRGPGFDGMISTRMFSAEAGSTASASGSSEARHLAGIETVAWMFPADRKLLTLGAFWSDGALRREATGITIDHIELVSYAPEKRATVRCVRAGATVGYAKLMAGRLVRETAERYATLTPLLAAHGVIAPELLHVDDRSGLVLISAVPGIQLARCDDQRHAWERLGHAVACLHNVPRPDDLAPFERASGGRLRSAARLIAGARPDMKSAVDQLLVELSLQPPVSALHLDVALHGDVHAKNALVHDGRLGLIDLDQAARGPAAADLGSALASLRASGASPSLAVAFLDGYARQRPLPDPAHIRWHTAAALLGERALRAVNRVRLDGLARLPELIAAARTELKDQS